MSMVKFDNKVKESTWTRRDHKAVRHKLPKDLESPAINYEKLRQLIAIDGLPEHGNKRSTDEAHKEFMSSYTTMFVKDEPKIGLPVHYLNRSLKKSSQASLASNTSKSTASRVSKSHGKGDGPHNVAEQKTESHDVRDYMCLLHKERKSEDPTAIKANRLKTLRKLLKKLPFERSADENDQMFKLVKHFPGLTAQAPASVLRELCVVAKMEFWKEENTPVFGNTGLHMVLRGSVRPIMSPHVRAAGEEIDIPCPTPEPREELPTLGPGECFGSLEKYEGREINTRVFTVITQEDNCDFLKISVADYKRVMEQMRHRDETEKVSLLQSCKTYKMWSRRPLVTVSELIEWVSFPANTVLVSEGYKAPFLAIVKSGECHVLRQVDVLQTLADGQKEKKTKQVVMGKLGPRDSFGELSVILDEPITCSIVTASPVELACIEPIRLDELDDVTLQLLEHSSEKTFGTLTQADIHDEYIKQEQQREWNEFKHGAIVESINSRGIRPGYGKWAK